MAPIVDFLDLAAWHLEDDGYLPVVLGRDQDGEAITLDLATTPHLLIAGATGSGKSVMVNTILCSLITPDSPEFVQLVLMDFKRVELAAYKDLPQLLLPIITEYDDAIVALQWLVGIMELRYRILERLSVRSIVDYNLATAANMSYIVVVIDEMADLMLGVPEAETLLVRLAQKARAVGIHLVLATQRPSVDVVTGLIKANVPARMAFAVASRTDSRVILDQSGAEELAGRGEFLLRNPKERALIRGQGAYVSDDDIDAIVKEAISDYARTTSQPSPSPLPTGVDGGGDQPNP
jgi:S-DNA-T family DNA segregation ATPase FtsK/SpoIIIE